MKKKEQSKREIQEDVVLNKVLWWIVGTVVVEFFVLLLNRFYVNYRVAEIDFALALRPVFHVLTYVLAACFVVLLIAYLAARRAGKRGKALGVLTVVFFLLDVCVGVTWTFSASGVKFLYIAVPVVGVLALVYYLYQHEFFLVAVLSALGLLGVWVLPHDAGTALQAYVMLAIIIVILVAAAIVCRMLQTKQGCLPVKGELKRIFPANANYALIYLTCIIVAVVIVLAFVLGALAFLYGVLVAWLLIMAVYYTVRMM
jgi:hypothetical protein